MNQIKVSAKRHLAKTISYRIISTLFGFLIMWWVTGNVTFGAVFGVVELLYKPVQYYIHERIWYRYIKFGLIEVKLLKSKKPSEPKSTLISELPEETQKKIKRLTYTKKTE
jgi:uncharacterized membrane protein